jgi:hypothetical protein
MMGGGVDAVTCYVPFRYRIIVCALRGLACASFRDTDGPSELTNRADGVSAVPLQTRTRNQFNDVSRLMECARTIIPSFLRPVHFLAPRVNVTNLVYHRNNFWFLFIRLVISRDLSSSSPIDFQSRHMRARAKTSTSTWPDKISIF